MKNFIISVFVNILALFIIVKLLDGVSIDSSKTLIISALVLTLIHVFIKPVLMFVSIPFNLLSLGIFTLFINAFLFYFASNLVSGFKVTTFWYAFLAAIMLSVITIIMDAYFLKKNVRVLKDYGNTPPK
jgi:putative membrane protein